MSDHDRILAQSLILECIKDKKLDLGLLKEKILDVSKEAADMYHGVDYEPYRNDVIKNLNRAAAEVLGVIPESKWSGSLDNVLTKFMNTVKQKVGLTPPDKTLAQFKDEHGLHVKSAPPQYNPTQSLEDQGYEFEISPQRVKQTQIFKVQARLNGIAGEINGLVNAAQDAGSIQHDKIHAIEFEQIEQKMREFIKESQRNPLLLNDQSREEVKSALLKLDKSKVLDNPLIANEVKVIQQLISPANKAAVELQNTVQNSKLATSPDGTAISSEETAKIEKKMKEFISKYGDSPLITEQSRAALASTMQLVQQKDAHASSAIADETKEIQKILAKPKKDSANVIR